MSTLDANETTQTQATGDSGAASAEPVSRRDVLKSGVTAAVAGGITALAGASAGAQTAGAPAVLTGTMAGRKFRGYARFEDTGSRVIDVTMLPLDEDRVVVRTEAAPLCYTMVQQALFPGNTTTVANFGAAPGVGRILGHGGVGVVEAVGSRVRRVQVGDRVVVHNTPFCGQCYNCVRGRTDRCQMLPGGSGGYRVGGAFSLLPIGTLADGTQIVQHNNEGGIAELMIPYEWYCMPIFSRVSALELSTIVCSGSAGLGCTFGVAPVEPASDVCVLGAGPIGLSAVQGAKIKGASQIIVVEPIRYRRELALRLGATVALDPNEYFRQNAGAGPDPLVEKVRELCSFGTGASDRRMAGQRLQNAAGPDFVIEAVGGDQIVPSAGPGPDPTGILPLQQAWALNTAAGHVCSTGVAQTGNFSVPGAQWANGSKNHHPGNMNGCNTLRDSQRFARLIETGQFNAKALAPATCNLAGVREGFQKVGNRVEVGVSLVFTA